MHSASLSGLSQSPAGSSAGFAPTVSKSSTDRHETKRPVEDPAESEKLRQGRTALEKTSMLNTSARQYLFENGSPAMQEPEVLYPPVPMRYLSALMFQASTDSVQSQRKS